MNYDEFDKKAFKNFFNSILPSLILWIISKEDIHGYGIMKKLNELFNFKNSNHKINVNSSKVYPILFRLENKGFIVGEWEINKNNQNVKFYSITDEGKELLQSINNQLTLVLINPEWVEFFKDMTGQEFK